MLKRDVYLFCATDEWRINVTDHVCLASKDKTKLEEALDYWTAKDYDEIAHRMLHILLNTPLPQVSLPVLGTITDDGAVIWSAGD